jgi:hypothetical protein
MDGQLDECNLTLKDLTHIEESFTKILLGIYHQRIDYPKKMGGGAGEAPTPQAPAARKQAAAGSSAPNVIPGPGAQKSNKT